MTGPILLAEDSTADANLAVMALERAGCPAPIVVARDGVEALDRMAADRPAIVLLDLDMPRLGGLDVLRRRRADPALRAVPVIVMSSSGEPADIGECYAAGANAYLVKPAGFAALVEAVRAVCWVWVGRNLRPSGQPPAVEAADRGGNSDLWVWPRDRHITLSGF